MDKSSLLSQLTRRLEDALAVAKKSSADAAQAVKTLATESEKKDDARAALEFGGLAAGHAKRLRQLGEELDALAAVRPRALSRKDPVEVGAVVEIEDDDTGEGRTFFVLPVGAGTELTGPGGDGYLTVVTGASPVGKAVLGRRVGETIELVVHGEQRAWTIAHVE